MKHDYEEDNEEGGDQTDTITERPERCDNKDYDPQAIEQAWYEWWDENKFFHADRHSGKKPFTIMIPIPNVTGVLHLGHALNNGIQDCLIRHARMNGYEALWMPGTDHAGVATQAIVEKRLWKEEQKTRHDLLGGREEMLQRIWEWKEQCGGRILCQLRKLGASLDWDRTQFTMSPEFSRSVRYVFLDLYRDGLIYRKKRLCHWSPGIQTALSHDELIYKTIKGNFWFFKYPLEGQEGKYIEIATTRPETMLGDTAIAVHPDPESELTKRLQKLQRRLENLCSCQEETDKDKNKEAIKSLQKSIECLEQIIEQDLPRLLEMKSWIGTNAILPLQNNRPIPIIGDTIADPEKGTGAVKITPAHDPNDFACGERNALPIINILNPDGTLNENAGGEYQGLHGSTEGRAKIVDAMTDLGLLSKIEPHEHDVAHCYRSDVPIEPYLLNQWYVRMGPLVNLAKRCYQEGQVQFHPEKRGDDFMRWLDSTPDWCISRQIYWGHRIPIWYCRDCEAGIQLDKEGTASSFSIPDDATPIVPENSTDPNATPKTCPKCGGCNLIQDPDVLDTWFSSQLWPLSSLGWPDETPDLQYFYPTSVLVTGRDILALWVARMIMMGTRYKGTRPFDHILLHGTIQDDLGNIMSKSRGNGFDPLKAIEGGTDTIDGKDLLGGMIPGKRIEHYTKYGADAVRYGLYGLCSGHKQDLPLRIDRKERPPATKSSLKEYDVSIPRFEEGKRFCNKIWQASRGAIFRLCEGYKKDTTIKEIEDRWLYAKIGQSIQQMDSHIANFEIGEACAIIYKLFRDDFCSWYLEVIKERLWGERGETSKAQAQTHLITGLDTLLRLLHPFMPHITEALWQELRALKLRSGQEDPDEALMMSEWPDAQSFPSDARALDLTTQLRAAADATNQMRSQQPGISNSAKLPRLIIAGNNDDGDLLLGAPELRDAFSGLARFLKIGTIETTTTMDCLPTLCATSLAGDWRLFLPLEGVFNLEAELKRLEKQSTAKEKAIERMKKQLDNPTFLQKADKSIIQKKMNRLQEEKEDLRAIQAQMEKLRGVAY